MPRFRRTVASFRYAIAKAESRAVAVAFRKSARRMGSRSSSTPWATREATGPTPATRMAK